MNPSALVQALLGNHLASPQPSSGPVGRNVLTPTQVVQQMQQQGWRDVTPGVSPQFQQSIIGQQSQHSFGRNPDVGKYNISPIVHQAIQNAAQEFKVPVDLMYDIAASEGGFNPTAKNTTPEGQSAGVPVGLYQFKEGTWNHDLANYASMPNSSLTNWNNPQREDPVANARAAAYLIKFGQLGRWDASKSNWGKFYNDKELTPFYSQTPSQASVPAQVSQAPLGLLGGPGSAVASDKYQVATTPSVGMGTGGNPLANFS